jgi:hypothetical protein
MPDIPEYVSFSRIGGEPMKNMRGGSIETYFSDDIAPVQQDARMLVVRALIASSQLPIMDGER